MASLLLTAGAQPSTVTIRRCRVRERLQAHLGARRLDQSLALGISPDSSVTISLRAHTLIGIRARRRLASSLRNLVELAKAPAWPQTSVPVCRRKIVAAEELIEHVADRLVDHRPVTARGVAQIRLLLTEGRSPAYHHPQENDLRPALRAAAEALEPTV